MIALNSLLVGVSLILANIGSRYLLQDLAGWKLEYLAHPLMRPVYLFSMSFASTRDFQVSLLVSVIYLIILGGDWFNIGGQFQSGGNHISVSTTSSRNQSFECPRHHYNCPEQKVANYAEPNEQWSLTSLNGLNGT